MENGVVSRCFILGASSGNGKAAVIFFAAMLCSGHDMENVLDGSNK
jgi:hypothetical protein